MNLEKIEPLKKIKSGIEGFEEISHGGLPKNRLTLISGTPGSGKTIFSIQFLVNGIKNYDHPGLFVTFEETPHDIKVNMKKFGWDIGKWEKESELDFVDASPKPGDHFIINGNYDLGGLITRIKNKITKIGAKRLVIDSLGFIMNKFPDKSIIRNELLQLKMELRRLKVTTILTAERYKVNSISTRHNLEEFLSDNVIILRNRSSMEKRRRTIEILKYRGSSHESGEHSFTIRKDRGIVVISFLASEESRGISPIRKTIGLKKLDLMMGGGIYDSSVILISGETGTGKTTFCLEFLYGGIESGEKVLMISFEEKKDRILYRGNRLNKNFKELEKLGKLKLVCGYPEIKGIEEHIVDLKEIIESFKPDRIILDSISALERITNKQNYQESIINLFLMLRSRNITGLFTSTSPTFMEKKNAIERHISTLTDVIIILRYVEKLGKIKRGLSIVKMRDSDHSKEIHEFSISKEGIEIQEPFKNVSGILGGKIKLE